MKCMNCKLLTTEEIVVEICTACLTEFFEELEEACEEIEEDIYLYHGKQW